MTLFGDKAARPIDYLDHCWSAEPFAPGGPTAAVPPGSWTAHGAHLRTPVGGIFWAGTETADQCTGFLDGAGRYHTFFKVTLPRLRDSISVAWVYLGFIALDMYALVFVMTPSQGGPNHASEIFASVIQFNAFQKGQFGYACAIAVALAIFTILLAALQLRITRRERIEF